MLKVLNNPLVFYFVLKVFGISGFLVGNQWWEAIENYNARIIGEFVLLSIIIFGIFVALLFWSWKNLIPFNKEEDNMSKYEKSKRIFGFSAWTTFHISFTVLDFLTFIDRYGPKEPILLPSFVNSGDIVNDSIWNITIMSYNAVLGNVIEFTIFWLIWKRRSWRSVFIFSWSLIAPAIVVLTVVTFKMWTLDMLQPLSQWYIWFCPPWLIIAFISIFLIPKDFTLRTTDPNNCFKTGTIINWLIALGQMGSVFILVGKTFTLTFPERKCFMTNWIRTNDPGFLMNDKDLPWSTSLVQSWIVIGFVGLIFALCIVYNLWYKLNKPNWLWDLSLVGFGILLGDMLIRLIQEVYHDTPEEYKGHIGNFSFWMINGFSLIVGLFQLISLYRIKKIYVSLNQYE